MGGLLVVTREASQMDNVNGSCGPPFQLPKQFQIVINTFGIQFERAVSATDERFTEANECSGLSQCMEPGFDAGPSAVAIRDDQPEGVLQVGITSNLARKRPP